MILTEMDVADFYLLCHSNLEYFIINILTFKVNIKGWFSKCMIECAQCDEGLKAFKTVQKIFYKKEDFPGNI